MLAQYLLGVLCLYIRLTSYLVLLLLSYKTETYVDPPILLVWNMFNYT